LDFANNEEKIHSTIYRLEVFLDNNNNNFMKIVPNGNFYINELDLNGLSILLNQE